MQFEKAKKFILSKLRKELPKNLTYHSLEHIKDVYTAAEKIGKLEGLSKEELTLLLTAVLFHDAGFLIQQKNHEAFGCDLVREFLPDYDYNSEQIAQICSMIMATQIPQTPKNKLEEIICDADLDYLGRDDFFTIGNKLFDELCMYGIINNENEWIKLQVNFLEKHKYFTDTSQKLRKGQKEEYLQTLKSKINN